MEIIPIKITTLSPVNYYYLPAAGGMRTSDFLGDIALKYATLHQYGIMDYSEPTKFKPSYEELNEFPFWYSVAINEKLAFGQGNSTFFMKNMIRNTMQGIDYNGTNKFPTFKEGSTMYKNFFFQQPIMPNNTFFAYLIRSSKEFDIPEAVRIGTNKNGVLKIEKYIGNPFRGVLNAYTIEKIMNKKMPANKEYEYTEHIVLQYFLLGFFTQDEILNIYEK
ncbi:MAG: type I-D CRISPR-associated protein Cas5/Csc1 [Thermoplasmata archaeon]